MRSGLSTFLLAIPVSLLGAAGSRAAGSPSDPPAPGALSEAIVVTATGLPEESAKTGSAVTVITREEIALSRAESVADLLRIVPGADLVQGGAPGQVASLFLRGAASRQVLVLVDGVRVADPWYGGYDWAHLPASTVDRIEVVRGPFSALYGTDAIGGVVQIFTRRGGGEGRMQASVAAGNLGTLVASAGAGGRAGRLDWSIDGSFRDGAGELENDDFRNGAGAARFDVAVGDGRVGLEFRGFRSELGIPFTWLSGEGRVPTPLRRSEVEERQTMIPIVVPLAGGFAFEAQAARAEHTYRFRDPDDAWGYTRGDTEATSDSFRGALRWEGEGHRAVVLFDWLRDEVDASSSYGIALDGDRSTTRAFAFQDVVEIGAGWSAVLGVRRDDNGLFGATTHPRGSLAWQSSGGRLRFALSAGSAFRAPSVGELHDPLSGNRELRPERSRSAEAGVEWSEPGRIRGAIRLFVERSEEAIDFDYAAFRFANVGRARSRGVELSAEAPIEAGFLAALDATWLDAEIGTKLPSSTPSEAGSWRWSERPRRPEWRGSARIAWAGGGIGSAELRALWVGRRPDADPADLTPIEAPSHLRVDLAGSRELVAGLSLTARVVNLLDRRYDEAAGYPAVGRSWLLGFDWRR
jgi:vitamin B12 transporter